MYKTEIKSLINYISTVYFKTANKIRTNIYRGHLRSISSDIEDAIALYIANVLPTDYKIFLDSSVHVNKKNNRPDLLVVDASNNVKAMIEVKSNMGWCRNATDVIDDICDNDSKFKHTGSLTCEFSRENSETVLYGNDVKLFLVSLTDWNCPADKHAANKTYAKTKGVHQFNLFSGWYDSLTENEISDFTNILLK